MQRLIFKPKNQRGKTKEFWLIACCPHLSTLHCMTKHCRREGKARVTIKIWKKNQVFTGNNLIAYPFQSLYLLPWCVLLFHFHLWSTINFSKKYLLFIILFGINFCLSLVLRICKFIWNYFTIYHSMTKHTITKIGQ